MHDGTFRIADREVGGAATYVVAELSGNHNQSFDAAIQLIRAAKDAGADAIKIQTYTADTITLDCENEWFQIHAESEWRGMTLHQLYQQAYTPWEWQPKLKEFCDELRIALFSSPFDETAVDFLEEMNVPAYKVASFELVDDILLRRIARTGKPVIMSTGMATLGENEEAVNVLRSAGAGPIALLKCTSAYPSPASEMNLRTIPHLAQAFGLPVGLSDHTLDVAVPVAAVTLGACIIEKHLTLSRAAGGPDSAFSLEPAEFRAMVQAVRTAEEALGTVHYGVSPREGKNRIYRRSLFVVEDVRAGEPFTRENVRSIRPGNGLHTRHFEEVLGRRAAADVARGTPLSWGLVSGE